MVKRNVMVLKKVSAAKTKLLQRVKKLKIKTLLKLIAEAVVALVIVTKMLILVLWEVNTLINK